MTSRSDNTAKWKELSEIDYFGLFIKNWLAFNSWYRGHHPQLSTDRECIEAIKNTLDARNSTFTIYNRIINGSSRESVSLKDSMDGLVTALNRITLSSQSYTGTISFTNALVDINTSDYQNLIKTESQRDKISLGSIYVTNRIDLLYKGTIEIIYQIRCLLFHGDLEPTDENHQVVKHAYLITNLLMKHV